MNRKGGSLSARRALFLILICLTFLAGTAYFCFTNRLFYDELLVVCLIDIVFLVVFFIALIRKRLKGSIYRGTSYFGVFLAVLISFVFFALCSFLPVIYIPVSIPALLMSACMDDSLAMALYIYTVCIYCICFSLTFYTIISCLLVGIVAVMTGSIIKTSQGRGRIAASVFILLASFIIPAFFDYLRAYGVNEGRLLFFGVSALISAFFMGFVYNFICRLFEGERSIKYDIITDENYYFLDELKKLSLPEFEHAKRLSRLSALCANEIGADPVLAAAAGMYYHAVNIEPDRNIRRFVKKLNNRCFPPELLEILMEDGSEGCLPSSKESAIVFMTDRLLAKIDAIFRTASKSDWNVNMIVYQTLNELSAEGVFDESGLGMNEFLKIRETLSKAFP